MDEEENFARLLSASTPAPRPVLSYSDDPWANPFGGDEGDAWGSASAAVPSLPSFPTASASPPEPMRPRTPTPPPPMNLSLGYDERPDPPSVIAAREREELAAAAGVGSGSGSGTGYSGATPTTPSAGGFEDPYAAPSWSPPHSTHAPGAHGFRASQSPTARSPPESLARARTKSAPRSPVSPSAAPRPAIPAGLIDEDLLTERDARTSLTRAFVKSDTSAPVPAPASPAEKKAYVFKPKTVEHKVEPAKDKEKAAEKEKKVEKVEKVENKGKEKEEGSAAPAAAPAASEGIEDAHAADAKDTEPKSTIAPDTAPAAIPLPESHIGTPAVSRPDTPARGASLTAPTGDRDRVSVSPLDTPAKDDSADYGFQSLAIGGSGEPSGAAASPPNRFGGRGWGAIDAEPLATDGDPWGGGAGGGWGQPGPLSAEAEDTPDTSMAAAGEADAEAQAQADAEADDDNTPLSATRSPRRSKLLSTPVFQITVSDPTKVGDPVRGHVVYTVRTKTTSPHYRRGDFSVLRRFSDFLWLFEQLSMNNPGVIVPPVPDKQPFGRFQDQFIETRRAALQRCLTKMTAHPILQLDPDLRLFLESDSFALDVKNRRMAPIDGSTQPSSGFMSSWTGPRYVEQDEWFDQRKTYLDHLEGQLKALSKALDVASKARLEMAVSVGEFADAAQVLADSDLGAAMCAALARLADLSRKERTAGEDQAKADVSQLLNLADEYVRFISSVRLAFASRVRAFHTAQAAEKEVVRIRKQREKDRLAGRLGDRAASSMAEVQEAERRARDANADFEAQTKLVKSEFARFERERVDEFRRTLTAHLDDQIQRQQGLVTAWEEYHAVLLKMVQRAQNQHQPQQQQQA